MSVVPPPISMIMLPVALGHRQSCADGGGHRFVDQAHVADPHPVGTFLDGPAFHLRARRGHADDEPGPREAAAPRFVHEVREHLFDRCEIGDDPVPHGPNRIDARGSAPEHVARLCTDGFDRAVRGVEGDD